MIIVEGPDGSGKSTLVRHLAQDLRLQVAHVDVPPDMRSWEWVKPRTYTALADSVKGVKPIVIHDRLFVSELVYGPILRGDCKFSAQETEYVWNVLGALDCPILYCLPSFGAVDRNLRGQKDIHLAGAVDHSAAIYQSYCHQFTLGWDNEVNTVAYDYEGAYNALFGGYTLQFQPYGEILDMCKTYIEKRRERSWG